MLDNGNASRRQFGQHAELYRKSRTHSDQATLNHLVELISPNHEDKALDVGCGGGHMVTAIARETGETIASDITPEMLVQTGKLAGEKGLKNLTLCLADANSLPFKDDTFDVVTCRIVLHHVYYADRAVSEMKRVLKKRGTLFIQDILGIDDIQARSYMDRIEKLRDPSHIKNYNKTEWKDFLSRTGLEVAHSEAVSGVYDLDEWTSRSGTAVKNVEEIESLLQNMPETVKNHLKASYSNGDWHISMDYILLLTKK
jgi:ubiquinone/menaquinone biosynthesis C-methylase UbiE